MNFSLKQLGSGFLLGFCVGFALKKGIKILALLIGFSLIILFALEYYGLKSTNDDQIIEMVQSSRGYLEYGLTTLKTRITNLELSGGIGAVAGFKFG
jgi:uncharacterized membrane protein (Fun14 family)